FSDTYHEQALPVVEARMSEYLSGGVAALTNRLDREYPMQTNSPISDAEMERRWAIARRVMAELGLDALVMQAREDWIGGYVRWFTDVPA
ncbi:hypothetical protein JI667_21495, partial [Bacillus sp. NTK074B]|uniref:hypothetical protein n=1 Tax=Bacillus sp. NTK074B TaxID=2802174 RepID=UPI001A8E6E4E|nr:hypothetical protein [Bacillus sp. NTK074B]